MSKVFSISYDLSQPGQSYNKLIEAIKSFGTYWNATKSVWFVVTNKSARQVYETISCGIDENDKVFINEVRTPSDWCGWNLSEGELKWIRDHFEE